MENIEITENNKELFDLQIKITDICNFILTCMDISTISEDLKNNMIDIIENNGEINTNLKIKDKIIAYSMNYIMDLYKKQENIMRSLKW